MKRHLLTFLAVMLICGATFGAMAVEAQSLIQPTRLGTNSLEASTQPGAESGSLSITSDRMFLFGVTVGVMASICTLAIVLIVSGQNLAETTAPKRKLRLKRA